MHYFSHCRKQGTTTLTSITITIRCMCEQCIATARSGGFAVITASASKDTRSAYRNNLASRTAVPTTASILLTSAVSILVMTLILCANLSILRLIPPVPCGTLVDDLSPVGTIAGSSRLVAPV